MSKRSDVIEGSTGATLSALPLLTLHTSMRTMEERAGVKWMPDDTELGPSLLSHWRLGRTGPRFSLRFFPEAQRPGIVVSADAKATEADIDALLVSLGVPDEEIIDRIPVTGPGRSRGTPRERKRPAASRSGVLGF